MFGPEPPDPFELSCQAIGWVECDEIHVYEAPRQPTLAHGNLAKIHIYEDQRELVYGLRAVAGFERLWIVFAFHLSQTWHPLVQPPGMRERIGVFASRAPHRPNRIGLSCVELVTLDGAVLTVRGHDLLHRTPVLDIKPYLPYSDSHPAVRTGWLERRQEQCCRIERTPAAAARLRWLQRRAGLAIESFLAAQLSRDPADRARKRVRRLADSLYELAYRTWRLRFRLEQHVVVVVDVRSGYRADELDQLVDPHADKAIHRAFRAVFA
jgi:tRNA-Thr(GGU) m(6)t(6)A37 methyltransferase TsaA